MQFYIYFYRFFSSTSTQNISASCVLGQWSEDGDFQFSLSQWWHESHFRELFTVSLFNLELSTLFPRNHNHESSVFWGLWASSSLSFSSLHDMPIKWPPGLEHPQQNSPTPKREPFLLENNILVLSLETPPPPVTLATVLNNTTHLIWKDGNLHLWTRHSAASIKSRDFADRFCSGFEL
jgi:hypothetical protein